ncbi:beta-lactamase class D [Shewanella psychrophila]|uniref:Beta-lactamase n=1 Tax=Shewanella psychrophila TaxID=225848 RepID=A0A1S6HRA2_9GAMM|nr:class D beta-lactamase [Shewanella psychrophila]AQS38043.1 beta-lactamase class D [Shewanella psychrophila]
MRFNIGLLALLAVLCHPAAAKQAVEAHSSETKGAEAENAKDYSLEVTSSWLAKFAQEKVIGVMVLLDEQGRLMTNDGKRAVKRFIPASTFKVPNSLLLLEAGIVKDEYSQFPWDGKERNILAWNRDHNFSTAMKYSVVPIYQALAREMGQSEMAKGVAQLNYGNNDISGGVDSFWLNGDLAISAKEQVEFLQRLYHNRLPVSDRSQRIVKKMMLLEANSEWVLRGKTGYAVQKGQKLGWFVGWLEREERVYFFALNMDIESNSQLPLRKDLVKQILVLEGLI